MKRLIRMLLVNWYRLEQQTIEIEGHTAIIGPNASGKSSLLDAIQAVLVGGHKDWWRPNASAGEKSTRSLRDYCLGVVRDPNNSQLSTEFKPRDQALTYLVLVFEDEKGERTSVGLAIQARLSESSERIDGRFIAPGIDMIMADLVDKGENSITPKPWVRLREELRSRIGVKLKLESQAERFQQQICAELSDGKRHIDSKRFLRAFRNAITFSPIKNVSDFVRNFILEERDIQVKALQLALKNYREIKRKTEEAQDRERLLETINSHYTRAEKAERLGMSWRWVEQEVTFYALETELEPLRDSIEKREDTIKNLSSHILTLDNDWKQADDDLQDANKKLSSNNTEQQRETLNVKIDNAYIQIKEVKQYIKNTRNTLNKLHKLYDHKMLFDNAFIAGKLEELLPHLNLDSGVLLDDWPLKPKDIEFITQQIQPLLSNEIIVQSQLRDTLVTQLAKADEYLKDLHERIKRLESGQSDLSPATQQLIVLLEQQGIEAVPLCDRVEVADENWRDALETLLGGHREALLVAPDKVREATTLYRKEGRRLKIFGSRIINTTKTEEWLEKRKKGSLADVIQSDDDHAIAYINRHIGNVLRVESENELVNYDRAITSDGMLASGGSITRLKFIDPMLGREARKQTLDSLKQRFVNESGNYNEIKDQRAQVVRFIDEQLQPTKQRLEVPLNLIAHCEQRQEQQNKLVSLRQELATLMGDSSYQDLKANVENAEKKRQLIGEERTGTTSKCLDLKLKQQSDQDKLKLKEQESKKVAENRRMIEQLPGFDATQASERLQELENHLLSNDESYKWKELIDEANKRASSQLKLMSNQRRDAYNELREYTSHWSSEQLAVNAGIDEHIALSAWVIKELNTLRETALAQFTREAKTALEEAEVAFRADFIGKLQDNLQKLHGQLDELNHNLKRRPFHGQYYRFIKTADKELEPVLKLVETWSQEEAANVGSLFDVSNDPTHRHYDGITKIRDLLMEASEEKSLFNQRLADYRQYFEFDVKMTDDINGEKNAELLSRRIGKGSGGEHQSPFYVAIGASLAAAYRIEREEQGGYRGGLGLAVFDEAFSKLDLQNTVSALGFLDELGLQVLLAAPDEKYGQIAEHVDTIVNVYRDGGNVYIDTDHIKPTAHSALAADNPVTRPSDSLTL